MRPKTYHVTLVAEQRAELTRKSTSQKQSARERKRARILLLADEAQEGGAIPDAAIAAQVKVCLGTVGRVRQRFAQAKKQGNANKQGQTQLRMVLHHKQQEKRKPAFSTVRPKPTSSPSCAAPRPTATSAGGCIS